jgi:hypothetical protein
MDEQLKRLGTWYGTAIDPVVENMDVVAVGPVKIGIEFRHLTNEVIIAAGNGDSITGDGEGAGLIFDDSGVSFHVFDAETDVEYLRFDCFDDDPHYHYMVPGKGLVHVAYDSYANGDMVSWALSCLRSRLPMMLDVAEAGGLAAAMGQPDVRASIDEKMDDIERAARGRIVQA